MSFGRKKPLDVSFSAVFYFCNMFSFFKKKEYKLTPIQELLLALLRAQLWLKPVDDIVLPSSLDEWDELINLGYKQTVICFIAKACLRHPDASNIPSDIKEEFEAVLEENKRIHEHHNAVLIELITKFEEQGLHPILLKGQGIAQMYPEPELRQCGDIDLFFVSEEYEAAKSYIQSIEDSIENRQAEKFHHFESKYKDIIVEIHRHTSEIPNPFANKRYLRFEECEMKHSLEIKIEGHNISIPSPLFNLVSVFVHMWNHFENKGVSLRQMCDVMMMLSFYNGIIPHKDLNCAIRRLSFSLPWQVSNCVFKERLGLLPCNSSFDDEIKYRASAMLKIIFNDGAFNFGKNKDKYAKLSGIKRRIAVHLDGHREFMKVYPVTGNRIWWRYAAFKKIMLYKLLDRWSCTVNKG